MNPPLISFVIGGVQKAGTSALAQYLAEHPGIALPRDKEAHVFDAPDFTDDCPADEVDRRFAGHFNGADTSRSHGDATPFYVFHPLLIARAARYNPALRWIILLRDPAERAVSHYYMERGRKHERWPLLVAMLLERRRLRMHSMDFSMESPLRRHSYRARGDYARQLDALYAHFPKSQVLLLRSEALMRDTAATLGMACDFLGVDSSPMRQPHPPVFVGDYAPLARNGFTMRCLRWLMRHELRAMRERYGLAFD